MNADRTVSVEFEPVSNAEENKGGGGGDCFISTSGPESPISQGAIPLVLTGIVLMGIANLLRKYTSN